jgi:hypothetical protein
MVNKTANLKEYMKNYYSQKVYCDTCKKDVCKVYYKKHINSDIHKRNEINNKEIEFDQDEKMDIIKEMISIIHTLLL